MTEDASTRLSPGETPRETSARDGGAAPERVVSEASGSPPEPGAGGDPGLVLHGTPVAPGLVLGAVHRKDYDLAGAVARERVPREGVEAELNRFHAALVAARDELADLKARLSGRVAPDEARILDTHVAYLKDSVFISDVENLILNEQMSLEASIGKVVTDFDRIFRLVQNAMLRERAVDLRDVGIRVLRHLEREADETTDQPEPPRAYVLVARELSIVDMFNLEGEHVLGILTEEGGLTSHAAILARSMRIPTITGIEDLLASVAEGDFVIVDASEGVVRVNPGELVRAQYKHVEPAASSMNRSSTARGSSVGSPAAGNVAGARTRDGVALRLSAACGNLPAVEDAVRAGFEEVGLYRTELLYLVDRRPPGLESLTAHYTAVLEAIGERRATFRLLYAESSLGLAYLHETREPNPALGEAGVRALFKRESVLRTQLQALALAAGERPVRVAVPFVIDPSELRRVGEVLFEERRALPAGTVAGKALQLGVVVETPAAVLGAEDLAREAHFLCVNLVALVQHLLACDRENSALRSRFEAPHPVVLRALANIVEAAEKHERPFSLFGASALPAYVPFLIGLGFRDFALPPSDVDEFVDLARAIDASRAAADVEAAQRASSAAEIRALVEGYRYGWAGATSEDPHGA